MSVVLGLRRDIRTVEEGGREREAELLPPPEFSLSSDTKPFDYDFLSLHTTVQDSLSTLLPLLCNYCLLFLPCGVGEGDEGEAARAFNSAAKFMT